MGEDPEETLAKSHRQIWENTHRHVASIAGVDSQTVSFLDFVCGNLAPDLPILDAGCGKGRHFSLLHELDSRAWGCDLSEEAIRLAKLKVDSADFRSRFQVAELQALPYPANAFAAAICVHTLPYHLSEQIEEIIGELERVIIPGGWLYADFLELSDAEYGHGFELENNTFRADSGLPTHFSGASEIESLFSRFRLECCDKIRIESERRTRVVWSVWAQCAH